MPEIETLRRLYALEQGQRLVYYTGRLDEDLYRSETVGGRSQRPPLEYADMLRRIFACADDLAREGKIKIWQHPAILSTPSGPCRVTEYHAEGR